MIRPYVLVAIFAITIFGVYIGYKVQKIPYNVIYNGNDIDELYEFVGAGRQADSYNRKWCDADYEISVSQDKKSDVDFFLIASELNAIESVLIKSWDKISFIDKAKLHLFNHSDNFQIVISSNLKRVKFNLSTSYFIRKKLYVCSVEG